MSSTSNETLVLEVGDSLGTLSEKFLNNLIGKQVALFDFAEFENYMDGETFELTIHSGEFEGFHIDIEGEGENDTLTIDGRTLKFSNAKFDCEENLDYFHLLNENGEIEHFGEMIEIA